MNLLFLNIALAVIWAFLTGVFNLSNLLVGLVIGYFVLLSLRRVLPASDYFRTVPYVIEFAAYFTWELIMASLRVAVDVMTPRHRMKPRVLAVPLDVRTDVGITLLSTLISLTPGSLIIDVAPDRTVLYIHAMYASDADAVRSDLKQGLERRVIRLLSGIDGEMK